MKLQDVQALIQLAQEMKVKRLKVDDFEVLLHFEKSPDSFVAVDPKSFMDPMLRRETEEDVLFWSSGGQERYDTAGHQIHPPLVGEQDAD